MKRVLTDNDGMVLDCLLDEKQAVELRVDPIKNDTCIGNIYIGKVVDVVKSVGAAFVDIGLGVNAFLPFSEIDESAVFSNKKSKKLIACEDELLVMVTREAFGTKPASLSTRLSVSGRYCVIISDNKNSINFSKKINDAEFKNDIKACITLHDGQSAIIRTNAYTADKKSLVSEINRLSQKLYEITSGAQFKRRTGNPLYVSPPGWLCDIRDTLDSTLTQIITDSKEIYDSIHELDTVFINDDRLMLYTDKSYSILNAYGISKAAQEATNERVWMNSGAYLVIQPTEALTVIDVNSGKAPHSNNSEDAYLKVNLEAAAEVCRQLRLRNLGGIIIVDFINMISEENKAALLSKIKELLKQDPVEARLAGLSNLGLVEITRKKVRKPVEKSQVKAFFV